MLKDEVPQSKFNEIDAIFTELEDALCKAKLKMIEKNEKVID